MDKCKPCPSIIAMFTSGSQHPPRSGHAAYLGGNNVSEFDIGDLIFGIETSFHI